MSIIRPSFNIGQYWNCAAARPPWMATNRDAPLSGDGGRWVLTIGPPKAAPFLFIGLHHALDMPKSLAPLRDVGCLGAGRASLLRFLLMTRLKGPVVGIAQRFPAEGRGCGNPVEAPTGAVGCGHEVRA